MDDQQRMMHNQGQMANTNVLQQYGIPQQGDDPSDQRKQEIGDILQQIMTITDQSLDEAQARCRYMPSFILCLSSLKFSLTLLSVRYISARSYEIIFLVLSNALVFFIAGNTHWTVTEWNLHYLVYYVKSKKKQVCKIYPSLSLLYGNLYYFSKYFFCIFF